MSDYISPFKIPFPELPAIEGVQLAAGNAGIKYTDRSDLLLAVLAENTSVAGVFTKSTMPGAPVGWCRSILPGGTARGLVVNAGNANVFTGKAGIETVKHTAEAAAALIGCAAEAIFVSSTGVIGEPLSAEKLTALLPELHSALSTTVWEAAAEAIMTTDTFPKGVTRQCTIGDTLVTINGITKGSGMIAPNMATTLGYVFTDAAIPAEILQSLLNQAIDVSYNAITVDSDTSTSDTVLVFATGAATHPPVTTPEDPHLAEFAKTMQDLLVEMAHLVVKDGEGISKWIEVTVKGAKNDVSAKKIALSIANSPLVKTAIAAEDANWGRIVMGIGKAGEPADRDSTAIWVGGVQIAEEGGAHAAYHEDQLAEYMRGNHIVITADVGVGTGAFTVWTCDLTHEYIRINAEYRS